MASLSWGIDRDSLRHRLKSIWILISVQQLEESSTHHIVPSWELIPCLWLKIWANFPPAPQVEFSLSNRYVRGTMCFLCQVEWTARDPDSVKGWISMQWLKFRFVFNLKRWRDDWIPCGDHRESRSSPPLLDRGNHIILIPREAHGIQGFKRWWCLTLFENG